MRVGWQTLGLLAVTACSYTAPSDPSNSDPDAASTTDTTQTTGDSAIPCDPQTSPWVDVCTLPAGEDIAFGTTGTYVYDTDAGTLTDPQGALVVHVSTVDTTRDPDLRVVVATTFTISQGTALRAIGTLPLAIVADQITIGGRIDIGGIATTAGAGGFASCGNRDGKDDSGGASGGGGGGFGSAGGAGGDGDNNGGKADGGVAGPAIALPSDVRGGCPGGHGGFGDGDAGGAGGAAGGGLLLVGRVAIEIAGVIRAGGGGGRGGVFTGSPKGDGGGGGGGSGGMIAMSSPSIEITGRLAANGGGGGEGSADVGAGNAGGDATDDATAAAAGAGGAAGAVGADGTPGGNRTTPAGAKPTQFTAGAGGGAGAGVGFIVLQSTALVIDAATISPAPQ